MNLSVYVSVVFSFLLVVVFKVKIVRVELIDLLNNHALQVSDRHVVVPLVIHRQVNGWCVELLLLGQPDVVEVGVLEGFLGRWSLIGVEL